MWLNRYPHVDIVKEDAKLVSVDKETELEVIIPDCTPLSKVEIRANTAQLQKIWAWLSAFRGDFV